MYIVYYTRDWGDEMIDVNVFVTPSQITALTWVNKFNDLLNRLSPRYYEEYNKWIDSEECDYRMPIWAEHRCYTLNGIYTAHFKEIEVR